MNAITIRTKGEAEIFISSETLRPGHLIELDDDQSIDQYAPGHTKLFADGASAAGSDPRTDHVAVIDHATGLMWAVKSIGDSDGDPMSQADCDRACRELRLLGHDDWRLPTRIELAALVDDTRHEPAIDTSLFPGALPRWHWTSTPCAWSSASAWSVGFNLGSASTSHRSSSGFALAVRRAGQ
ncbi:Lcl C-terminal domain-containing protein [Stenotrophomonas sp. SM006]